MNMRIGHHIAVVVLVCSLGGAGMSLGLTFAYRNLEDESRRIGKDSLEMRDLDHVKALVGQWLVSCDLVVASAQTYMAEGAAVQAGQIEDLLSVLRHAMTTGDCAEDLTVISDSVGGIAQAVATAAIVSGPERASRLEELSERVDAESTRMIGALDVLSKRTTQRVDQMRISVDTRRRRLALVTWLLGGAYIAVVVLVWRWSVFSVVRPLRALSEGSQEAALDQPPTSPYRHAPTEIKELTRSITAFVHDLDTARARAERANHENRDLAARFSAILDNAADGIIAINDLGCIELFNAAAERMFGYTVAEVVGKNVSLLMPSPYSEEHDGHMRRYFETGARKVIGVRRETIGRRKDGTTFPVDLSVSEVRLGVGRIFTSIVRDITERNRAEEELRGMGIALDRAMAGISRLDTSGRYAMVSNAYAILGGYEPDEMIGMSWEPTVLPEDREGARAAYREMLAEGKSEIEARGLRKDGSMFDKNVMLIRRCDHDGEFAGHYCVIRDITERKEAEKTLRLRARQQAAIAELGHSALGGAELGFLFDEAVAVVAETLDIEYCKVLELLPGEDALLLRAGVGWKEGLAGRATVGTDVDSQAGFTLASDEPVIVDDLRTETRFSGPALLSEHGVVSGMSVVIGGQDHPFGVLGVHTTARRTFNHDDTNFLSAVANVLAVAIERSRAEGRLREAHARSEAANRAKSDFLANISHEIHTPMNGIVGMCELALDTELNDEQREYLDTVLECSNSLLKLFNDILDFSKVETGKLELETSDFDLVATIKGVVDMLAQRAEGKGLELISKVHPSVPRFLRGDPGRLRQVLVNLTENAIKFTEHGEVTIDVQVEDQRAQEVSLQVSVFDTGIGIPTDRQAAIFERFTQADGATTRNYGGTGLGLAICKQLVELMGGAI
jgi:PAS domain S-box-containing protein